MPSLFAAIAVGSGILFFLIKSRLNYLSLPEIPAVSGAPPLDDITVIIPARNEAHNIERCVSSFRGVRVIVVDDASADNTAALARAAGAEVIAAPPLGEGLMGKPNACQAGADLAVTHWILFVDADTRYKPDFLPSLLEYSRDHEIAAASVFLRQECISAPEKLLLPYAFALYFCGVNGGRVNEPKSSEALANGQCLLFRREAYEYINGHRAVAGSVIEDVALAALMKRHRMKTRVLRAEALATVRMYDNFTAIWRGFQKNSFRFLLVNPWSGVQVVAASILLTSYLPVMALLYRDGQWRALAAFALVPTVALLPWYGSAMALLAPFAIYLFQLIVLNAMLSTIFGRKALWKGRRV